MPVHVAALLAVPAVAGGFLQAFQQLAFLMWPFNLVLPLARHLPRTCAALGEVASFYDAELRRYASGAARLLPRSQRHASPRRVLQQRTHGDLVAHAMVALVDISY